MTLETSYSYSQPDKKPSETDQWLFPQFEEQCLNILSTVPPTTEVSGSFHNVWTWQEYNKTELAIIFNPDDDPIVSEFFGPRRALLSGLRNIAAAVQYDGSFQEIRVIPLGLENAQLSLNFDYIQELNLYNLPWLQTQWLDQLTLPTAQRRLLKNHLCTKLEKNWKNIFTHIKTPLQQSCDLLDVAECKKFLLVQQQPVTDLYHWLVGNFSSYPVLIKNVQENADHRRIFGDKNGIVATVEENERVTMFACAVASDAIILGRPIDKNVQELFTQEYFRLLNISNVS